MSLVSGIRGFSVSMYGQSGIVMDWFGLNDPFTQQIPLKITNSYSGTLWFQSQLVNPRSGYFNYSGIQLGNVGSGASATLVATWDAGVSGWITGSSPITDTLTLNLTTFTSSNYTGSYSSGNFTVFNTLFNRYSGVIKVFGDIYNNDQPTPSLTVAAGGTFASGQTMSYAVSYNLSGWESDIGASTNAQTGSPSGANTISVSWSSITGVSQYFLWRWSGSADFTSYSGVTAPNAGFLRPMDLVAVQATTGFTDTNVVAIQASLFRHRTWQKFTASGVTDGAGAPATSDTTIALSSPSSRRLTHNLNQVTTHAHGYQVGKNLSGTSLLGPFYGVLHIRNSGSAATQGAVALALQTSNDGSTSGTTLADANALSGQLTQVWYRHTIQLGASGSISSSGQIHIQLEATIAGGGSLLDYNVDDVFIVAQS